MQTQTGLKMIVCQTVPAKPHNHKIYVIPPNQGQTWAYWQRVDRNLGWISKEEQLTLKKATIGIAGCGGIGGYLAETFHRTGMGRLKLADNDIFETPDLNRQFAASQSSLKASKVLAVAGLLRSISADTELHLYPQGLDLANMADFCRDCDIICDNLDIFAPGTRILLHQTARAAGIPLFNSPAVGFGGYLFVFNKRSPRLEDLLDLSLEEAWQLERDLRQKQASLTQITKLCHKTLKVFAPALPAYAAPALKRLLEQGKVAVPATSIPFTIGFAANKILHYYLAGQGYHQRQADLPPAPGYCHFDAVSMQLEKVAPKEQANIKEA